MVVVEVNGYTIEPGADLREANLREANLRMVDFTGADLRMANLTRANLGWADLTRAKPFPPDLTRAILERAVADARTVWPEGFDPAAAGVIFDR